MSALSASPFSARYVHFPMTLAMASCGQVCILPVVGLAHLILQEMDSVSMTKLQTKLEMCPVLTCALSSSTSSSLSSMRNICHLPRAGLGCSSIIFPTDKCVLPVHIMTCFKQMLRLCLDTFYCTCSTKQNVQPAALCMGQVLAPPGSPTVHDNHMRYSL